MCNLITNYLYGLGGTQLVGQKGKEHALCLSELPDRYKQEAVWWSAIVYVPKKSFRFFLIEFLFAVYHVSVLRNMCFQTKSLKKRIILLFTIQEICLSDPPVVMTLVDGPTGDSDNMICVAYRHQFDLVNESTGESYRLHHIEANKVSFQHRNCFLAEPH